MQPFVMRGEGKIPPTPLLRKGGFLRLAPSSAAIPAPTPSFRRRPESRTPVGPGVSMGQRWIPAFAGMTMGGGREEDGPARIRARNDGASLKKAPLSQKGGRRLAPLYGGCPTFPPSFLPSPSFPPPPSFPRKRESTSRPIDAPGITGVLDSGAGRNDGGDVDGGLSYGVGRRSTTLPHPTLSRWEKAFYGAAAQCPILNS